MNVEKFVRNVLKKHIKTDLERKLEAIRVPCMNYLKENALRIFKEKITEVYTINSDRIQVIDLPLFLRTVKAVDKTPWSFKIVVDENLLNFQTKSGEQIYQYTHGGTMYSDGVGEEVHSLSEYWHSPIANQVEDDWYKNEAAYDMSDFIKNNFIKFIVKKITEVN